MLYCRWAGLPKLQRLLPQKLQQCTQKSGIGSRLSGWSGRHCSIIAQTLILRRRWAGLPKPQRLLPQKRQQRAQEPGIGSSRGQGGRGLAFTIDRFYLSRHCAVRFHALSMP